jgi:hypothetical protein
MACFERLCDTPWPWSREEVMSSSVAIFLIQVVLFLIHRFAHDTI